MDSQVQYSKMIIAGLAVAVLSLTSQGKDAMAHDDDHRIAGHLIKMSTPLDAWRRKFIFKAKKQLQIYEVSEDLTQATSTVIVRGSGANAGASSITYLNPSGWRLIGKADNPKGWKYKADYMDPDSGGIYKAMIKKGRNGGKILIKAKGVGWDYAISGPQDSVEVSITLADEHYCANFATDTALFKKNQERLVMAKGGATPVECSSVCGNGRMELSEECDDGDQVDTDTCSNQCQGVQCDAADDYESTFAAVQDLIFDSPQYACSNTACHGGANPGGGLDLTAGNSWAELVNVPSQIDPSTLLVMPADQGWSMLYTKLEAKTEGGPSVPGTPMPANAYTVTDEHLELLYIWIRGGAPETGVVSGTAELLEACMPDASPNEVPRPDPPAAGTGVQMSMPQYKLDAQSETENCNISYYDITDLVPEESLVDCAGEYSGTNDHGEKAGKCAIWNYQYFTQDPQSHHAIFSIYNGNYDYDHSAWGAWTCQGEGADGSCVGGANDGASCTIFASRDANGGAIMTDDCGANSQCVGPSCDARADDPCPSGGDCATSRVVGAACTNLPGPAGGVGGLGGLGFSGAQESVSVIGYPEGVYRPMPLKGIISWNSHAFNLTNSPLWLDAFINLHWTDEAIYRAQGGILGLDKIFVQNVPPFEQREYCATLTMPNYTNWTEISSHTHRHGKRFRMWLPPQEECDGGTGFGADPDCLPGDDDDLFYESLTYEDARYIRYHDEPWDMGNGDKESRTIKYCSLYDNGYDNPSEVKRQSTSPTPAPGPLQVGGPCSDTTVACMDGPNKGNNCYGNDFNCPQSECDACPATGGLTTEDEMFLVLGFYYIQKCGNGNVNQGSGVDWPEECDDGGNDDGDGCSKFCEIEDGYTCTGEPSVCQ